MSFPGIIRRLFANNGAGPKLRGDILPLELRDMLHGRRNGGQGCVAPWFCAGHGR